MSKVRELVEKAVEFEMEALAITDHHSCGGHYDLMVECRKAGIKPIYGMEAYMSIDEATKEDNGAHINIYAKTPKGLQNLYQIYNRSFDNFYRKPNVNFEILKTFKEDLIIASACIGGTISQAILDNDIEKARKHINEFKKVFGDDFYLEVQPNDIPDQYIVNKTIFRLAKEENVKVVATNDVHYTFKDDPQIHEVLLAMQVKQKWDNPKRFKFPTNDYWFKNYDEMIGSFIGIMSEKKDFIQALKNTYDLVDKIEDFDLPKGNFMPHYPFVKPGQTERQALEQIVNDNFKTRYNGSDELRKAINHELDVIDDEGYSGYFLIVQDYIRKARERGVLVGDGRGSGAGSKVCYLTDITRVDPVKHGLIFERFLDRNRIPDIDTDFSNQEIVFKYLQETYGERNVARIITYGTLTAKSCTRKIMGVFGYSMAEIAKVIGYMPNELSFTMDEALKYSNQLVGFFNSTDERKFMLKVIKRLEGVISQEGKHAGGVVIYPDLAKYLPLKMINDDNGNRTIPVACLTKYPLEDSGFVKFDILGLETLPILHHTLELIKEHTGKEITLPNDMNSDLNDEKVYDMLKNGDVLGIFQLNSQAGKVMEQAPKKFSDVVALTSIIRPGTCDTNEYMARRNGKEWYVNPIRQKYLRESEGMTIYQEQYLHDAHFYAGWAYGFGDKHIRKNKKIKDDIKLQEKFISDSVSNGFKEEEARKLWLEIVDIVSGGYSFNKSHAVCYSVLTYQCAWLKAYYPNYFYCALLSSKMDNQEEVANIIAECKRKGIKLLPPSLNNGTSEFTPSDEGIRIPLNYLKGVGEQVIPEIIKLRPIISLEDLFERRTKSIIKKNVINALIKAGCFDFEDTKNNMMWKHDMLNRKKTEIKNNVILPNNYPLDEKSFMMWEKEALGMCLSAHPLDNYNPRPIWDYEEGGKASMVAEITDVSPRAQKNGKMMAFITLETPFGIHKGLCFANTWASEDIQNVAKEGNIVLVKGKRSANDILIDDMEIHELANQEKR